MPRLLTLLFYVDNEGGLYYFWLAIIIGLVTTVVSFVATKAILTIGEKRDAAKASEVSVA